MQISRIREQLRALLYLEGLTDTALHQLAQQVVLEEFAPDAPPIAALLPVNYERMGEMVGGFSARVTKPEDIRPALERFDRVLACKSRRIDPQAPDATLELLGIEFHPGDPPGGSALLLFNAGAALRLDVECLECELTDLGPDDIGLVPEEP